MLRSSSDGKSAPPPVDSFKNLLKIPYWIFASVWIVVFLTGVMLAAKIGGVELFHRLTPGFIETLLVRYDWLTIIYFPIVLVVPLVLLFNINGHPGWFSRRTSYAVDGDELVLSDRRGEIRIAIGEIKNAHLLSGRKTFFPIRGKGPSYRYHELTCEVGGGKQTFCSVPYRIYNKPQDFERFVEALKRAGVRVKTTKCKGWYDWFFGH